MKKGKEKKKEGFEVGEVFQLGIVKLKAVPSDGTCTKCFLYDVCAWCRGCKYIVGDCYGINFVEVKE